MKRYIADSVAILLLVLFMVSCGGDGGIYEKLANGSKVPVAFVIKSKDGGFGGEWYGKMRLSDYDQFKNGNPVVDFVLFEETYYINDKGLIVTAAETRGPSGVLAGYSNNMILSKSAIYRIIPRFKLDFNGTQITVTCTDGLGPPAEKKDVGPE